MTFFALVHIFIYISSILITKKVNMKNIIKIIGIALLMTAFTQSSKAQTSVGGGLSFFSHTGSSELGFNARGNFALNESMEITPGFTYYLADGFTLMGFNGDFHYLFGDDGSVRFYPLAGLNLTMVSAFGSSKSEFQINVGGGTKLPLNDKMSLYGEGKYIIGDFDGLVFSAGLLFNIGG